MEATTMNKNIFEILSDNDKIVPEVSMTKFNGREVVPYTKIYADEYPVLSTLTDKTGPKQRKKKNDKKTSTTFFVGTSYSDTKILNHKQNFKTQGPRSQAFTKMEDKQIISKSLTCTRACKNVKRDYVTKKFGICYRETCSFAHCLDELNDPMCGFDSTCRFRWGKPLHDGSIDTETKCIFRHSDETREDWSKRTMRIIPDLPVTAEKTRKITQKKNLPSTPVKTVDVPSTPVKTVDVPSTPVLIPEAPRKFKDYKWGETQLVISPIIMDNSSVFRYSRSRNRSRSRSRSRNRSRSPTILRRMITVPTKELAEIAIKEAFNRGVYNIHVVVE
jgi:hypothetical protein